jgi:hypothetical protein
MDQVNNNDVRYSVAKGPKFQPQSTKRAEKNWRGWESQGPNFCLICQKRAEKGPNFFFKSGFS